MRLRLVCGAELFEIRSAGFSGKGVVRAMVIDAVCEGLDEPQMQ